MALTTPSLTSQMTKHSLGLGSFRRLNHSTGEPYHKLRSYRFMAPAQRVVMEDGYTVLFRAGHTKA